MGGLQFRQSQPLWMKEGSSAQTAPEQQLLREGQQRPSASEAPHGGMSSHQLEPAPPMKRSASADSPEAHAAGQCEDVSIRSPCS